MQLNMTPTYIMASAFFIFLLLILIRQSQPEETFTPSPYWSYIGAYKDKGGQGRRQIGCRVSQAQTLSDPVCKSISSIPKTATIFNAQQIFNQDAPTSTVMGIQNGGELYADINLKKALELGDAFDKCSNPLGCGGVNQVYSKVVPSQTLDSKFNNVTVTYVYIGPYFNDRLNSVISNVSNIEIDCPDASSPSDCLNEAALIANANKASVFGIELQTTFVNGKTGFSGKVAWGSDLYNALKYGMVGLTQIPVLFNDVCSDKTRRHMPFANMVYAVLPQQVANLTPETASFRYYGTYKDNGGQRAFPIQCTSIGAPTSLSLVDCQRLANEYGASVFGIGLSGDAKSLVLYFATFLTDPARFGVTNNTSKSSASIPLTATGSVTTSHIDRGNVLLYAVTPEKYVSKPRGYAYLGAFSDNAGFPTQIVFKHKYLLSTSVTASPPDTRSQLFLPMPYTIQTKDAATIASYLNAPVYGLKNGILYFGTSLSEATRFGATKPEQRDYTVSVSAGFQIWYATSYN